MNSSPEHNSPTRPGRAAALSAIGLVLSIVDVTLTYAISWPSLLAWTAGSLSLAVAAVVCVVMGIRLSRRLTWYRAPWFNTLAAFVVIAVVPSILLWFPPHIESQPIDSQRAPERTIEVDDARRSLNLGAGTAHDIAFGVHRERYSSGQLRLEYPIERGHRHGLGFEWRDDGSLAALSCFIEGVESWRLESPTLDTRPNCLARNRWDDPVLRAKLRLHDAIDRVADH